MDPGLAHRTKPNKIPPFLLFSLHKENRFHFLMAGFIGSSLCFPFGFGLNRKILGSMGIRDLLRRDIYSSCETLLLTCLPVLQIKRAAAGPNSRRTPQCHRH